jgi:alpha-L-rhamnosidase
MTHQANFKIRNSLFDIRYFLLILLLVPLCGWAIEAVANEAPTKLEVEFLENPLALDTDKPRFSWIVEDATPGAKQTAYQIQAASSPDFKKPLLWDSGKVVSDQSHLVEYAGKPLASRQCVFWRVKSWDQNGTASNWAEPARFEIGLLSKQAWAGAKWIKTPGATNLDNDVTRLWKRMAVPPLKENIRNLYNPAPIPDVDSVIQEAEKQIAERLDAVDAAPLFRKSFRLDKLPEQARAYFCGLGIVELRINGRRVGDAMFTPAVTAYEERAFYQACDITGFLREGENVVGVIVSPGRYNQPAAFGGPSTIYGDELPLIVRIEGDNKPLIVSDPSWKTSVGPILKSHYWIGEVFDATQLEPGWDAPGFDDSGWTSASPIAFPTKRLVAQMMPPERVVERVEPVELTEPRPGVWVFKFPKAITGMVELDVEEPVGTRICMRYSERVFTPDYLKYRTVQSVLHYENFEVSKEEANGLIGPSMMGVGIPFGVRVKGYGNRERVKLQLATPMDLYVCRGSGPETWHRRSAYTPFQFVELTGLTNKPSLETVTALIVHTDLPKTGTFHSSEPLFERIVEASDRSLIYCTHGIVQDNPGREKGAYAVMATLNDELAACSRDYAPVWSKILADYRCAIRDEFGRPRKKPVTYRGTHNGPDDIYHEYACAILPMTHYRHYGDLRAVEKSYPFAKGFLDYYLQNSKFNSVLHDGKWGDYAAQLSYADLERAEYNKVFRVQKASIEFIETAKLYESCLAVAQMAGLLGKSDDAALYRGLADKIGVALNEKYYDASAKTYGLQSMNSLAVMLGFAPEADRQAIADNTVRDMNERFNGHFAIGHHVIPFLFRMLSEYGHAEKACSEMLREDYPGLGHMLTFGTETMMDQWPDPDGEPPIAGIVQSENTGHVEWFHRYLCGIRPDDTDGGYKHFTLQPVFPAKIDSAGTAFQTTYGELESRWKREGDFIVWNVTVPWNTTATVKFPGARSEKVAAGNHQFNIEQ